MKRECHKKKKEDCNKKKEEEDKLRVVHLCNKIRVLDDKSSTRDNIEVGRTTEFRCDTCQTCRENNMSFGCHQCGQTSTCVCLCHKRLRQEGNFGLNPTARAIRSHFLSKKVQYIASEDRRQPFLSNDHQIVTMYSASMKYPIYVVHWQTTGNSEPLF